MLWLVPIIFIGMVFFPSVVPPLIPSKGSGIMEEDAVDVDVEDDEEFGRGSCDSWYEREGREGCCPWLC